MEKDKKDNGIARSDEKLDTDKFDNNELHESMESPPEPHQKESEFSYPRPADERYLRKLNAAAQAQTPHEDKPSSLSSESKQKFNLHKYFLYTLVGGLIIAALISVVAVLIGDFNSTVSRALGTTGSMVAHTLVALFIISVSSQNKSGASSLLSSTLLLITIASFITTILQIWEVITGRIAYDLYVVYFYTFCASLWSQLLLQMAENFVDKATRIVSFVAIGFTWLFWALLLPTIFTHYPDKLTEFHYRALAATVIVLATMSVLTIVFRRIYVAKNPELKSVAIADPKWDVLVALVVLIIGLPFIFGTIASLMSYNSLENTSVKPSKLSLPSSAVEKNEDKTQVTEEDLKEYVSVGKDCSELTLYTGLFRNKDKGQLKLIDIQSDMLTLTNGSGTTYYYWKSLPGVVDKNCKPLKLTDIKTNAYLSLYAPTSEESPYRNIALIQTLE